MSFSIRSNEEEYDTAVIDMAYEEYLKDPVTYSIDFATCKFIF